MTAVARENARRSGVSDRIAFRSQDVLDTPLGEASVVAIFLSAELNQALRPKLIRELSPGARVVSHWHDMGDWKPDRVEFVRAAGHTRAIYMWTIANRAAHHPER
jgi:hypothetical protein